MTKIKHQIEALVEAPLVVEAETLALLERTALAVLAYLDAQQSYEVTIVITDDTAMQELNRRFRGIDHPTDVLSFAEDSRGPFAGGVEGLPNYLGDIVISLQRAQKQAESAAGALVQELQLLVVHGMLHLLGYDHAEPSEKAQMWTLQAAILQPLGVNIPLPE